MLFGHLGGDPCCALAKMELKNWMFPDGLWCLYKCAMSLSLGLQTMGEESIAAVCAGVHYRWRGTSRTVKIHSL